MKNITKQYQDLLEGKMNRDNFVRNARMQFPQFISPVTSVDDAIKILKSKRIIAEVEKKINEHHNDPNFPGGPAIHDMLDRVAADWGKDSDLYNELEDAIVGWSDRYGNITPKGKIAIKALLSNWDVLEDYGWLLDAKPADHTGETTSMEEGSFMGGVDLGIDENKKKSIKEAADLTISQIVDRLNPYTLKLGIAKELEKVKVVDDINYAKALETAAKKLQKDPNAYKDVQFPNAKDVEKHDNNMQMVPVKDKNHVDEKNKMQKPTGQEKVKANTSTSTKENKKGKPKGVKELGTTPKKAPGITKVMDMPGKEKVLSDLKEALKKTLAEDTHHKYNIGTDVHTPEGPGVVIGVLGGTISVQLNNGDSADYQINVLDSAEEKAHRDMQFSKMPDIETPGQHWTSQHVSEKDGNPKKDEFTDLVSKYDWYHEMSDDDRKHQAALEINKKLFDLAKEIGEEEAIKIFNSLAPKNRQIRTVSDLREVKKTNKQDTINKLREYIKKALKKEAVKFKAGGETIFKNSSEASPYEADLKKSGVKYTKTTIN